MLLIRRFKSGEASVDLPNLLVDMPQISTHIDSIYNYTVQRRRGKISAYYS